MRGRRNPESDRDRQLRKAPHSPRQRGKILWNESRAPVTPVREIKYRNPLENSAIIASRSSVDVGAARKIVSSPRACIAARYSTASSGVRSVASTPSAPARGRIREFLDAHLQDRIEVAEKHQRHIRLQSQPPDQLDHARERRPAAQRPFARPLNRRAIGHRIAERHAQLDHVRAGFGGGQHDFLAGRKRRIASRDVRDQAQLARLGQLRENVAQFFARVARRELRRKMRESPVQT